MDDRVQTLLGLTDREARRRWLADSVPLVDQTLVAALRGEAYRRERDNPHGAVLVAEAVADAAEIWGDVKTEAAALHIAANAHHLLADHVKASALFEQAEVLYESLGLDLEKAHVMVGHMAALKDQGLYEEALAMAEWASNIFRSADQLALAKLLLNRGNLFARLDRYHEARANYAEARTIFESLGNQRYLAIIDVNDANVLVNLDDFRQAEKMFKQARAYFVQENMANVVAQVDDNLAYLYYAQGQFQRALITFNQSHQIFAAQGDLIKIAYGDLHRSDIYLALNLWQEALDLTRSARPHFESANRPWETARLWLNEAAALAHIDVNRSPDQALGSAYQIFAQESNAIWLAVTDLYQATFDLRRSKLLPAREKAARARQTFQEAGLRSRMIQCDIILGEIILDEGNIEVAISSFVEALLWLQEVDLPALAFACRFGLGRAQQKLGYGDAARHNYRLAISDIERLQAIIGAEDYKIAFLRDKLQVYEALILLCLELATPEAQAEAFTTVEQAKSRTLLDLLARTPVVSISPAAEEQLLARLHDLKRELNWYYSRLNEPQPEDESRPARDVVQLTKAISEREKRLGHLLNQWRSPDLAAAPHNPIWTTNLAQLQPTLPPESMLLEYYVAGEKVIAFGLSKDEFWVRSLPTSRSEIAEALGQFRFQINKFSYGRAYQERHAAALQLSVDDALHRLYQTLWAPLADQLSAETIIVVPHNLLHYAPFHAFYDGSGYLVDHKTISYAPSATILQRVLTVPAAVSTQPPLILGVPDPATPHVAGEVEAIARLFPEASLYFDDQATLDRLTGAEINPAFLHLATHAAFRADNPLFSVLKLADGWLNVHDIYQLRCSTSLITLSACETGRNYVLAGDELVGLCRGFLGAGAKSLVVSLWAVEDQTTTDLMTEFYQNLRHGLTVNAALSSAQRSIRARLSHPYFWAPFILMGKVDTTLDLTSTNVDTRQGYTDLSLFEA